MAQRIEYQLGALGGAIGLLIGILSFIIGGIVSVVRLHFQNSVVASIIMMVISVIALFGAGLSRRDRLIGGIVMVFAAILGFAISDGFFLISSIIVLLAGIIALVEQFR
jgi:hypothetical protein